MVSSSPSTTWSRSSSPSYERDPPPKPPLEDKIRLTGNWSRYYSPSPEFEIDNPPPCKHLADFNRRTWRSLPHCCEYVSGRTPNQPPDKDDRRLSVIDRTASPAQTPSTAADHGQIHHHWLGIGHLFADFFGNFSAPPSSLLRPLVKVNFTNSFCVAVVSQSPAPAQLACWASPGIGRGRVIGCRLRHGRAVLPERPNNRWCVGHGRAFCSERFRRGLGLRSKHGFKTGAPISKSIEQIIFPVRSIYESFCLFVGTGSGPATASRMATSQTFQRKPRSAKCPASSPLP